MAFWNTGRVSVGIVRGNGEQVAGVIGAGGGGGAGATGDGGEAVW